MCGAQVEPEHESAEKGQAGSERHERREELEDREVARDGDLVLLGFVKRVWGGWGGWVGWACLQAGGGPIPLRPPTPHLREGLELESHL